MVGKLGLVDHDRVSVSNLHRQIAHSRVGQLKVDSLRERLLALNPEISVETFSEPLSRDNALPLLQAYDLAIDATDNAATRYLLNDACVLLHKPLVSGAAVGYHAQLTTFLNRPSEAMACYRCLHPLPPNAQLVVNCDEGGVMGPVVGMLGSLQALEVLRLLTTDHPSTHTMLIHRLCGEDAHF